MSGTRGSVFLVGFVLVAFVGCSCSPGKVTFDPTGKHKMEEISQMLAATKASGNAPPARLADLERVEPLVPLSANDLRSGDVVYVWGASISTGNAVLAYEKKAATEGGWVLMQDGAVRQMTPAEFNAAPKAK